MVAQTSLEPTIRQALAFMQKAQELLDASDQAAVAAMLDHAIHALQFSLDTESGK